MNEMGSKQDSGCNQCSGSTIAAQSEIKYLRQKLLDRDIAIIQLEAKMAQDLPQIYSQGQLATARALCDNWQDKYERLLEAHKRLQKVNQGLEDKLLRQVDRSETEKAKLTEDAGNLSTALTNAAQAINRLKCDNERYQKDLALAVQLLQCNPSQYTSHKIDLLPTDVQQKAKFILGTEPPSNKVTRTEAKIIRVPIPTFPPTAMVYSVNKYSEEVEEEPMDHVSAAIMAAILEEREKERSKRHCPSCTCKNVDANTRNQDVFLKTNYITKPDNQDNVANFIDVGTQTLPSYIGETGKTSSTCIYCHSKNSPKTDTTQDLIVWSDVRPPTKKVDKPKEKLRRNDFRNNCPWDWTPDHDSGSPSTPTSLMSASLSYESEVSSFTSPHESPGHISLHDIKDSLSKITEEFRDGYPIPIQNTVSPLVHKSPPKNDTVIVISSTTTKSATETTL